MAVLTVSNVPTVGATYTTIAAAIAAAVNNDTIEIIGGVYGSFTVPSGKKIVYRFLHGAKIRGTGSGTGITVGTSAGNQYLADFYNLDISGFSNQIQDITNSINPVAKFYDCNISGNMSGLNYNFNFEYTRCIFIGVNFRNTRTPIEQQCIGGATYCIFINCTQLGAYARRSLQTLGFNNNIIHNSSFWIFRDVDGIDYTGYRFDSWVRNVVSGACTFKSTPDQGITLAQFDARPYVSVNSVADMQAKITADAAALSKTNWTLITTDFTFKSMLFDAYYFASTEANYLLNRAIGPQKYATTATVAGGNYTPNTDFTLTSTYLERNTTSSATLVFTLPAIARARKVRRLLLHFERETPVVDESMGASGTVQLSFEPSLNGVDYLAPVAVKSGLIDTGGGVYAFDLLTTTFAKTGKVSVTLSGTVAGNIRLFGVSCEFYALEDLLTQAAGRLAINQLGPAEYGYFLVDAPYSADFDGVVLTARQVKDNAAITKTYADGPANTNIISLVKDGISYSTFEPQELIITGVRAVTAGLQANKKVIKEIEAPCDFSLKMVKFLNRFGVSDYILFYAKAETKANKSDSEYIETLNGYRNVGGDLQYQYRLFRNDFPNANAALLTDLDRNQNIWLANKWQISANKAACSLVGSGLTTYQRLVKFPLVSDAEYFEFADRFAAGDSVSLISIDQQLSIWGTVTQLARVSPGVGGFMLIAFETPENETAPLFDLDAWIADELELFVVASPAWEAVTFQNMTTVEDGHGQIFIELQLKGQPEAVYRV